MKALSERSFGFDQDKAISELPPNGKNGFFFRFDDQLASAVVEPLSGAPVNQDVSKPSPEMVKIDFSGDDSVSLVSSDGQAVIREGKLYFIQTKESSIETRENITLEPSKIGEIVIRMRVREGKRMVLAWSVDGELLNRLTVYTFPSDSQFHTYRIQARDFFSNTRRVEPLSSEPLSWKLTLYPSDVLFDEIAFDYIHFVSKKQKYQDTLCGMAYESIDAELRPVLFMCTPLRLTYSCVLPAGPLFFRTGLGILGAETPVECVVRVRTAEQSREILSSRVDTTTAWQDVKVELSDWAGQQCNIVFEATGPAGDNVVFWSNPVLYGYPEEKFNVIVVLEDALRADHLYLYGHSITTSPFKDAFYADSMKFNYAF